MKPGHHGGLPLHGHTVIGHTPAEVGAAGIHRRRMIHNPTTSIHGTTRSRPLRRGSLHCDHDPDEHIGFHSNYISERLGVKILHIFVQSGTDDQYWGPLSFEQRVGHIFEDTHARTPSGGLPFIGVGF